jgi:multidrug efflux pump subunit AcrA (membrane-fusion protein)
MLAEELAALAVLAGNTVVTAATTDVWEAAKRGFARLLGRGDPDRTKAAERRLAETGKQLSVADTDLESARSALQAQWATRLADLLEEDPSAESELRALIEEVRAALPGGMVSAADHSIAAGRDLKITASGGGVAAGVIHGNVAPPGPSGPGPAIG